MYLLTNVSWARLTPPILRLTVPVVNLVEWAGCFNFESPEDVALGPRAGGVSASGLMVRRSHAVPGLRATGFRVKYSTTPDFGLYQSSVLYTEESDELGKEKGRERGDGLKRRDSGQRNACLGNQAEFLLALASASGARFSRAPLQQRRAWSAGSLRHFTHCHTNGAATLALLPSFPFF